MESAYVLEIDGAAKTALISLREKIGERGKVRVKNVAPPHDVVVVDAWWSGEDSRLRFNYVDGKSNHVVEFGREMADMLLRDCE